MRVTILTFDTLDSTNTEAIKQAKLGADEGLCIVAREQTAGRGRHGRSWVSSKDAGLYFSIVLRPRFETQDLPLITLMTGIAVHQTLAELGIAADIKWVNDLLVNERKICGILAETTDTPTGLAVVVGVGINLRQADLPEELASKAVSIEELVPGGVASSYLTSLLTNCLSTFYEQLSRDAKSIVEEWSRRSSYFSGKAVRVVLETETVLGVTDGLESNGALRILKDDGSVAIIQAGDVEKIRTTI